MKFIHLFCLTFIFGLCTSLTGQSTISDKLDTFLDVLDENQKAMGSVSLYRGGQPFYHKSIGFADIETDIKANEQTLYRIGSVSKIYTAVMIMQEVEQGRLSLSTTLDKFFPEVVGASKISIEHLLKHQSGLYNITDSTDYVLYYTEEQDRKAQLARINAHQLQFDPGAEMAYSNSNFILLTYILEDINQQSFTELLNNRICKPCQISQTGIGRGIDVSQGDARSYAYMQDWSVFPETHPSVAVGAGAVYSTANAVNQFLSCLYRTDKLLNVATIEQMQEMDKGYGLGMFTIPFYEQEAIGHTGGIDGFQSNAFYFPEADMSIVYLSNGINMPLNDILIGVLSIYFERPYEIPNFDQSNSLDTDILASYIGNYSNPNFPLDINIFIDGDQLAAQATGQGAFNLEYKSAHTFVFTPAQIEIAFNPEKNEMYFKQAGLDLIFTKK